MGILDKILGRSGDLKHKAEKYASEHGDKIGQGLDKASGAANKATKGRFESQIGKATDRAKGEVGKFGEKGGQSSGGSQPGDGTPPGGDPSNPGGPTS